MTRAPTAPSPAFKDDWTRVAGPVVWLVARERVPLVVK